MTVSKNAIITLTAEVIEVTLEDQNLLDGKNNQLQKKRLFKWF